jgi:hypothetical protein
LVSKINGVPEQYPEESREDMTGYRTKLHNEESDDL